MPEAVLAAIHRRYDHGQTDCRRDLGQGNLVEGHAVVVVIAVQAVHDGQRPLGSGRSRHRDRPAHSGPGETAVQVAADLVGGFDPGPGGWPGPLRRARAGAAPVAVVEFKVCGDGDCAGYREGTRAKQESATVLTVHLRAFLAVTRAATVLARISRPRRL